MAALKSYWATWSPFHSFLLAGSRMLTRKSNSQTSYSCLQRYSSRLVWMVSVEKIFEPTPRPWTNITGPLVPA
ncbi:hypothetical protein D3C84_1088210 [compost metagenome]